TYKFRKCECDALCPLYADCCLDSKYYSEYDQRTRFGVDECVSVKWDRDVYMKKTCPKGWEDAEVEKLCQKGSPESSQGQHDPVGNLPVTSKYSNITYANYYCAICNHDSQALNMWDTGWKCNDIPRQMKDFREYAKENLVYRDEKWGVLVHNDNGDNIIINCTVYPKIPEILEDSVRDCTKMMHSCSGSWTDMAVEKTCRSYSSPVMDSNNTIYKNIHCAICNNLTVHDTVCYGHIYYPGPRSRFYFDFTILFDIGDSSGSNIVGSVSPCERTEIWDPFSKKCRSVVCPKQSQVYRYNKCIEASDVNATLSTKPSITSLPSTVEDNLTTTPSDDTGNAIIFKTDNDNNGIIFPTDNNNSNNITDTAVASNVSSEFLGCHKIHLSNDEFSIFGNGTVYVYNYSKLYEPDEYQLDKNGVYVCTPVVAGEKYSPVIAWVSLVGMGVSCICMTCHLVAFLLVPELRNIPGKNIASLCLSLLVSNATFIINMFVDPNAVACLVLAAAMYFFFLSSFCWMNVTAFDIWYTFKLTKTKLRVSGGNQWRKFLAYSLYSWVLPGVAVASVIIIDTVRPDSIPKDFLPYLGERWCWFGHRKALLVFFALPMTILIILNCAFFISTAWIITETTLASANNPSSSHHKNKYKIHLRLAVLMGFTWLSGTLAGYLQLEALWYVFVVLTTLQGAFIFIAFTCRRKVWRVMGINIHKIVNRCASITARKLVYSSQNTELKNTTPATSMDGF
ncbi:hypothetical protein SK128_004726, partial [Halocaridina rubra]